MFVVADDGTRINVEVDGPADAPPIVVLHGVILSSASWAWLVPLLADRYRVLRVDLRGHGASGRAPGAYDLAGFVSDARAVIEQAADGRAFVVGHSLGGVTAAALAQQSPSLVSGLVLEDPALVVCLPVEADEPPPSGPLIEMFRLVRSQMPRAQASGMAPVDLARMLRSAPTPFGVPVSERYHDDVPDGWAQSQLAFDVVVLDRFIEPPGENLGEGLDLDRPFGVPTTVLAADLTAPNRVISRRLAERIQRADPTLRFERLPGAGHNMHDERASRDTFVARLRDALKG